MGAAGPRFAHAEAVRDATQRSVDIAAGIAVVVPAGPPAQVLLHALAPGKLAGLVEDFATDHAIYVDPRILRLPTLPMLSRHDDAADIAKVAVLKPGLVVDYGNVSPRYVKADQKIEEQLKVPAVLFDGKLAGTSEVARNLGVALGVTPRADAIAALADTVLKQAGPVSALPDDKRVPVYMARGTDGLMAARAGTSFDEPIRLAGGRNVVTGEGPTFRTMAVADVVALKPAVVVFAETEALSSPLRKALPPETKIVLDAGEPYRVLLGPPSLNRLVGLAALAPILHPDMIKADPEAIARIETALFPIPPSLAVPAPLQTR